MLEAYDSLVYPLVICYIAIENLHVSWVNQRTQLPFSIAMLVYQRVKVGSFAKFVLFPISNV